MNTLRRRLAGLYTITAGTILLLVMAAFCLFSLREAEHSQLEQFQLIWSSLSSRFQSSTMFTHGFLARTEADYNLIIHIRENGIPFRFQGSWTPATDRDTLIRRAMDTAGDQGVYMDVAPISSTVNMSSLITISGDHSDRYYAKILSLAAGKGVRSICVISRIPPVIQSLGGTIPYVCVLSVLGIGGLWLMSWYFVGWSLKPVEESRKKQAGFIAAASHELRSPLAVLKSAAHAMNASPSDTDALLPLIDQECSRMSRLVDDMLLLASSDAETWSVHREEVDMDTLLIDLFEFFCPVCKEKGVSLGLELPEEPLPVISGDPQRLRQLLMILLDNAKNYTPAGRSVTMSAATDHKNKALILAVTDQGYGIPDEHKPYIFDRFYRADSARADKEHFGLGLSIAKELARLHHGTISVKDGVHGGTCFVVTLPWSA